MEAEQLYACQKCRYIFATVAKTSNHCKECGSEFVSVPISYSKYVSMTSQQKEEFKASFFSGQAPEQTKDSSNVQDQQQNHAKKPPAEVVVVNEVTVSMGEGERLPHYSGWVTFLNTICNFLIGICVAGGILFALASDNIGVGILAGAFFVLIACLIVASTKVFLEIAIDIREIRNKLNT